MAHQITGTDNVLTYAQPAWHKLGTTLPHDHPSRWNINKAFKLSKLDWEVGRAPMQIVNTVGSLQFPGNDEPAEITPGVAGRPLDEHLAVYRKDTNEILGVVGRRYHVLQNKEQFKFFEPFLESKQAAFEVCGSLRGGRVVWVLARLERKDSVIIKDSKHPDTVRKYLLLTTTHDGTGASYVGFCPTRVVCWNTLSMALNSDQSQLLRVKHTRNQLIALQEVQATINAADKQFEATAKQYRKLAQVGITEAELIKYVKLVYRIDEDAEVATRTQNKIDKIVDYATNGWGSEMSAGTVWGAYNGITQYVTHEAGRSEDTRLHSQWQGEGQLLLRRALELATQLAA